MMGTTGRYGFGVEAVDLKAASEARFDMVNEKSELHCASSSAGLVKHFDSVVSEAGLIGPARQVFDLCRAKIENLRRGVVDFRPLLLWGPAGTGKSEIAKRLKALMLCELEEHPANVCAHVGRLNAETVHGWKDAMGGTLFDGLGSETRFYIIDDIERVGKGKSALETLRGFFDRIIEEQGKTQKRWFVVLTTNLDENNEVFRTLMAPSNALGQRIDEREVDHPSYEERVEFFSGEFFKEFGFSRDDIQEASSRLSMRLSVDYLRKVVESGSPPSLDAEIAEIIEIHRKFVRVLSDMRERMGRRSGAERPGHSDLRKALIAGSWRLEKAIQGLLNVGSDDGDDLAHVPILAEVDMFGAEIDARSKSASQHEGFPYLKLADFWQSLGEDPAKALGRLNGTRRGKKEKKESARCGAEARHRPQWAHDILAGRGLPSFGVEIDVGERIAGLMSYRQRKRPGWFISQGRRDELPEEDHEKWRKLDRMNGNSAGVAAVVMITQLIRLGEDGQIAVKLMDSARKRSFELLIDEFEAIWNSGH